MAPLDCSMTEEITLEVSDEDVALEVAYGIIGRAQDIHENNHDQFEDMALELRAVGHNLAAEYGEEYFQQD